MAVDLEEPQHRLREAVLRACEALGTAPRASEAFPAARWRALCEAGLLDTVLGDAEPGHGRLLDATLVAEVLARRAPDLVSPFVVNAASGWLVRAAGDDGQRDAILPGLCAGRLQLAFAMTEPGAGSDAAAIATTARRDGDAYRVRGEKLYTTGAADADFIVTVVRSDPDAKASRGTSLLLVPAGAPGLRVEPMRKIAGNHHASCRVAFDGVRVAMRQRLGEEHGAWPFLREAGGVERLLMAASSVGAAEAILDEACAFVTERHQFGAPVASFQAVQHRLADMATDLEAMRWLAYRAAAQADRQGPGATIELAMAKLFATERVQQMALDGMRLLGGRAYLEDTPMARRQRELLLGLYAGGTNEIQRNLVSRFVLAARDGPAPD